LKVSNPWREAIEGVTCITSNFGNKVSNPWREAIEAISLSVTGLAHLFPILGGRLLKALKDFYWEYGKMVSNPWREAIEELVE